MEVKVVKLTKYMERYGVLELGKSYTLLDRIGGKIKIKIDHPIVEYVWLFEKYCVAA